MGDVFGSDGLFYWGLDYQANAIFTMQDVWTLNPEFLGRLKTFCPYVPIDQEPVPPIVLDRLRYAYKIITLSKFGYEALERAKIEKFVV